MKTASPTSRSPPCPGRTTSSPAPSRPPRAIGSSSSTPGSTARNTPFASAIPIPVRRPSMSRSSIWAETRSVALVLGGACALAACAAQVELRMRQPIAMGPWTFDVRQAVDRTAPRAGQQLTMVTVTLALHTYEERHAAPVDDFLHGPTAGSMISYPHLTLKDASGTTFDGWLTPVSGGSLRSREWSADFVLVPSSTPAGFTGDAIDLAGKYLGTRLSDL